MSLPTTPIKEEPVSDWGGSPPTPKFSRPQMAKRTGGRPGVRKQVAKRTGRAVKYRNCKAICKVLNKNLVDLDLI